jgi:uncharacterized protein YdeI (YjbR/CyaY-like superfamily)
MDTSETMLRFATAREFSIWLDSHEEDPAGAWLVVGRKGGRLPVLAYWDALLIALAHGWIDSLARRIDQDSFAQRFTPRRTKSPWSQRNRDRVTAMAEAGELSPRGAAEMKRAQSDGRWPPQLASVLST